VISISRKPRSIGTVSRLVVVSLCLLLLTIAPTLNAQAETTYDRLAACRYAQDYWDKTCSDGYYFAHTEGPSLLGAGQPLPTETEGFDCAHFVSCCVGSEPNEPAGGLDIPSRTSAYGEPGAQRLVNWLMRQGATRVDELSAMVPGDLVAYDHEHDGWIDHVALYMGDGLVTAHSLSRFSEWNPDPAAEIILLHLPGPYEPPPDTLGYVWLATIAIVVTGLLAAILLLRYP